MKLNPKNSNNSSNRIDPAWFTGFVDGEGCFNVDVHINKTSLWFLQMQPEFIVVQHERDKALLECLPPLFGCGNVTLNREDATGKRYMYRVKNIKDIHEKIIPFFEQNPLQTKKSEDYQLFKQVVDDMYNKRHLGSVQNFTNTLSKARAIREKTRVKRTDVQKALSKGVELQIARLFELASVDPNMTENPDKSNLTHIAKLKSKNNSI